MNQMYSLLFWIALFVVLLVSMILRSAERISRDRMILRLVESGRPIPTGLFGGCTPGAASVPMRWYSVGRRLIGIGIGALMGAIAGRPDGLPPHWMSWVLLLCALPFLIGAAFTIASLVARRSRGPDGRT